MSLSQLLRVAVVRMKRICRIRLLAGLVVGAVVVSGCTTSVDKAGDQVAQNPVVLLGIDTRASQEIQPFVDEVATLSGGSMKFVFHADWHKTDAAADAEAIAALRAGSVDFAVVPVRAWHAAGVSSFDALIAPMVVDSYALQDQVLQDPMVGDMLTGVRKLGLTGIGVLPGPLREPAGIARDLLLPSDFRGARIAFSDGAVADRSLRQLGATPIPSAFNGADLSHFDGLEQQVSSIDSNNYDGIVRSVTSNITLWPRPYVIVGTAAAVGALTKEQLGVLTAAAKQAVHATSTRQEKLDSDAVPTLCRRAKLAFLTANADQLQKWREAFRPVNEWLAEDPQTKGFFQRIGQLQAGRTAAEQSIPACSPTGPGTVPAASTSIDGLWEVTVSKADLISFGVPGSQAVVGDHAITRRKFNRGHFIETMRPTTARAWIIGGSGRYSVNGDRLSLTFDEGGAGKAPNTRRPGETEEWIWSLNHGRLTLRWADSSVPPADYPAAAAVKPWTRIDDAPDGSCCCAAGVRRAVDGFVHTRRI